VLLGESLAALQVLGAALVIGGVMWSQRAGSGVARVFGDAA
jgi:drug/metabolite transporter (DMT)-like permease